MPVKVLPLPVPWGLISGKAQQGDDELWLVMQYMRSVNIPTALERRTLPLILQQLLHHVSRLAIIDGVLYKKMINSIPMSVN